MVNCDSQQEVDHFFWTTLSAGGQEVQCGGLKDKFGLSWQIVRAAMMEMLYDQDPRDGRARHGRDAEDEEARPCDAAPSVRRTVSRVIAPRRVFSTTTYASGL